MRHWKLWLCALIGAWYASAALAEPECGDLTPPPGLPGPYDYRLAGSDPEVAKQLAFVRQFHFTPDVEALRKGASSTSIAGDLHFTLMVFPNHHRALAAMSKLSFKENRVRPQAGALTIDCYFDRALRFRPNDATVRMIYGIHLLRAGQTKNAIRELEAARDALPQDANVQYNLGLAYFDAGDFANSLQAAKLAYALGFPLPGLKQKLVHAGKWRD
jgi:tetratricopeptide (TPR) repeat protein